MLSAILCPFKKRGVSMFSFRGLVFLFLAVACFAKSNPAPLPDKLLSAKTVFLDNKSGTAYIGDDAYDSMSKWGRFSLVNADAKPDVIFRLQVRSEDGGTVTSGDVTDDHNGGANVAMRSSAVVFRYTVLSVVDPATNEVLWQNEVRWGSGKRSMVPGAVWFPLSTAKSLIGDLRKRIDKK